jgi:hypothetical protein
MIIAIATAVAVGALVLATLLGLIKLNPLTISLYSMPLLILSLEQVTQSWSVAGELSVLVGFLALGYVISTRLISPREVSVLRASEGGLPRREIAKPIIVITSLGCIYHFAKTGIPLLSSNVELSRLDVGSSGLFGVPSRLYLFGTLLVCAIAVAEARSAGRRISGDAAVRMAFGLLIVSRVLSGFKSGLWQCVVFGVLLAVLALGPISLRRYRGKLVLLAAAAVIFAYLTGSSYSSYQTGGSSVISTLETRLTSGSAQPVALSMELHSSDVADPRSALTMDLQYLIPRYFRLGTPQPYGFTRLIASRIAIANPISTNRIAPVTVTGYGYARYQLGRFAFLMTLALGLFLGVASRLATRYSSSALRFALLVGAVQMDLDIMTRGEFVYAIINWAFIAALLCALVFVIRLFEPRHGAHPGLPMSAPITGSGISRPSFREGDLANVLRPASTPRGG